MAQRRPDRQSGMAVPPTTAPPVLSLPPNAFHDFSTEPELFSMDAAGTTWQANHINTLPTFAADVDQAHVCREEHLRMHDLTTPQMFEYPNVQFVGVEAGSAQRLLTEQIAHAHPNQVHQALAQAPYSCISQPQQPTGIQASFSAPIPASTPRNIAARPTNVPEIAVSDWSPYGETSARLEMARIPRSAPQYAHEDIFNTPSTSFRSTESAFSPWYDETGFEYLARPDLDLHSPITSQSPLSFAGPQIWSGRSVPAPQAMSQDFRAARSYAASSSGPQQLNISFEEPIAQTTVHCTERDGSDLNKWVQGAYTVSDRTQYGSLVPRAGYPSPRRRRVSRSRAGSTVSLSCGHEGCDKTFPSKSARE